MADITIHKLGKKYKQYPNRWARLAEWLTGGRYRGHVDRWALRNLSLQVEAGESLGIIGQNGAGKSTLLKILTGTTQPTEGHYAMSGRVAALLELGMGFHSDFTGRQNAVMACQMAGLRREEIQARLPEIEDFSELGDYLDRPLRVYSTGMQMRLAFSAATAVRPQILIVDEALSVGDSYFQHKCIRRIRHFKENGTTLLFVSHDPSAVKSLCDRAILLDKGALIKDGAPDAVLDYYNALIAPKSKDDEIKQMQTTWGHTATRSGSGEARILQVDMQNEKGLPTRVFRVGEWARIHCKIVFNADIENPTIGILIRDRLGNDVFGTNTHHLRVDGQAYRAGEKIAVVFALRLNLGCGHYSLCLAVHAGDSHLEASWDWWDQCLVWQMIPGNDASFTGLAALPAEVRIQKEKNE
ncbi:MAG: ABC transporter ATP-binding protein [Desulfobacterales bacterium]|nr:MAG: ABC transporter ATP-binding protein [Desulfobacterales bacterium]